MKKVIFAIFFVLCALFLLSCGNEKEETFFSEEERDVIIAGGLSSSSSEGLSSSSSEEFSSSSYSSSEEQSSSSNSEESSSSSEEQGSSSSSETSSSSEEQSSSSSIPLCGGETYDSGERFCRNDILYDKCGDGNGNGKHEYDPDTQFCYNNSTIAKCGGKTYTPPQQVCNAGIVQTNCGGSSINETPTQSCCNIYVYNPTTHLCHTDGATYSCGNKPFNPSTQFCYKDSKIGDYCGTRTETFDPDLYECRDGSKIYLKNSVGYYSVYYDAVVIGTQVWMTKNLSYAVTGSKCVKSDYNFVDAVSAYCDMFYTHGVYYTWATAMQINASCDNSLIAECGAVINNPHQGVCPSGWHIPTDMEWTTLSEYIGGYTQGAKLKATNGWGIYNGINLGGTDDYGFAALPTGGGHDKFEIDGSAWFSATEINSNFEAYGREIVAGIFRTDYYVKSYSLGIRCLKDSGP